MSDEPAGDAADDRAQLARLAARMEALESAVARIEMRLGASSAAPPPRPQGPPRPQPIVQPAATAPPILVVPPVIVAPPVIVGGAPGPARARARGSSELEGVIAGRWLNRIGLVAVAVGMSYFLKYAIDNDWIGPAGQVAIGALLGAGCLASTVWFLKKGYAFFADGMTGLGASILFLSLWAAGSYYHLVPLNVAFGLMAIVTGGIIAIAIARNSETVAIMALIGGFLTPVLVSTGQDAEVALFLYLIVLDAALLPLAWLRDWRMIELPAFVLTQAYFWGWYDGFYRGPDQFARTAVFASLFFVVFLVLPILRSRRTGAIRPEHGLLLPANALSCLAAWCLTLWPAGQVSTASLGTYRWSTAGVAVALALVHTMAARAVPRREGAQPIRLLFAGVALMLATIAIPLRLSGQWITMAWAVEGAILMWTGFRVRVPVLRFMAYAILAIAGAQILSMAVLDGDWNADGHVLAMRFLACAVTVASYAIAIFVARPHFSALSGVERGAVGVLSVAANVLALWTLTNEVRLYFRSGRTTFGVGPAVEDQWLAESLAISVLWTAYATGLLVAGVKRNVAALRWQGLALFGLTTLKVFFNDLASLQGFYRIASSIALGVVLLVVSFMYQRSLARSAAQERP